MRFSSYATWLLVSAIGVCRINLNPFTDCLVPTYKKFCVNVNSC